MLPDRAQRLLSWTSLLAILIAGCVALLRWWPILSMEANGALESDAHLYFTVGRGMLNGIPLWSGLFESKPPGMFQLAALSSILGGAWPAIAFQLFIYLSIPGMLAACGWIEARRQEQEKPAALAVAGIGMLFGFLLDFYLEERAGGFQSESVGVFFSCTYLFLVLIGADRPSKLRSLGLGLLIFGAIWVKEPFVLPLFGASLLVARNARHWLAVFLIPSLIAGVIELTSLLLLGSLGDYVSIYLPSMVQTRIGTDRIDPLYLRGFTIGRLYGNIVDFYFAPIFGYVLTLLWLLFPYCKRREEGAWWDLPLAVITSFAVYHSVWYLFFPLVKFNAWELYGATINESVFPSKLPYLPFILLATGGLLWACHRRGFLKPSLANIAALWCAATAVGISVYAVNHFAFAIPVYATLGFVFVRYVAAFPFSLPVGIVFSLLLWGSFAYHPNPRQIELLNDRSKQSQQAQAAATTKLDGMLDACDIDRYGAMDVFDRFSFAKHSPLGPVVVMHFFEYLTWEHPLIVETQRRLREDAAIIISGGGADHDRTYPSLADRFTEEPPECAKPYLPLDNLKVYFRKTTPTLSTSTFSNIFSRTL